MAAERTRPYAVVKDGVRLAVRLQPGAARDGIDGVREGADGRPALHLRLRARPIEGAANAALIAFLSKALVLRKADIVLHSGETSRLKILHLHGAPGRLAGTGLSRRDLRPLRKRFSGGAVLKCRTIRIFAWLSLDKDITDDF
jgi:uncharacterized protein (TIGR00251 family)